MEDKIINLHVNNSNDNGNPPEEKRVSLFKSLLLGVLVSTFMILFIYNNGSSSAVDSRDGLFFDNNVRYSRRLLQLDHEENVNPTIAGVENPWWDDVDMENMPIPGEPFEYYYQDQLQNMTLNTNVTWYSPQRTLYCHIQFDEDGNLDSNTSYIEILDDFADTIHIDSILLAGAPQIAHMNYNCSIVPAVIVIDIVNDTENGILTLKIREAEMFDYIDEVDCNLTNISLIDSGVDYGEARRVKKLVEYFGNDTQTIISNNGTVKNITFSNVTYSELETMCQTFADNGTLIDEFPMINGTCAELDAVDYFGQQYGIDSVTLAGTEISAGDLDTFGVGGDGDNFTRRRLFFRRLRRRIKRAIKKVVKFVKDVIDILRGDINVRLFDFGITIDASKTYSASGEESVSSTRKSLTNSNVSLERSANGSFSVNAGVDFHAGVHSDLRAKYKIFSKNPSFDLFKLTVGGETHFKVYIDINIDGTVDISFEIARVERRKTFMLGPVPILLKLYSAVTFGVGAELNLDFAFEFGYRPTSFEYGVEWTKSGGWKSIEKNMVFEPFKNFGTEDDESCLEFLITPFVEVRLGVVFYEVVDVFVRPKIELPILFEFPATCDDDILACNQSPDLLAKLNMDFAFSMALGLEVSGSIFPNIKFLLPLPFADIGPIPIIDDLCFPMSDPIFTSIGFLCCGPPQPSPTAVPSAPPTDLVPLPWNATTSISICENTEGLNVIKGSWDWSVSWETGKCSVDNTNRAPGNLLWFGSFNGESPDPVYSARNFIYSAIITLTDTCNNDGGLIFRAASVSSINTGGQQYYLHINNNGDYVGFGKINDGFTLLHFNRVGIDSNTPYELMLVAEGSIYNVYLDGDLVLSDIIQDEYITGSVGLRTFNCRSTFSSVTYIPQVHRINICENTPGLNIIKGSWEWTIDDSGNKCILSNINRVSGNNVWFGSSDGLTPNHVFENTNFIFSVKITLTNTCNNGAGILFRALSVSSINNQGEQYYVQINNGGDYVGFAKIDNGVHTLLHFARIPIDSNIEYELMVEAKGTIYNVYLDGDLVLANIFNNEYISGSIGLRTGGSTGGCRCSYSSITYITEE